MARRRKKLHVGVAQIDITPPVGMTMTGYIARAGNATGVHDSLFAKALVFDNGAQQALIHANVALGGRGEKVVDRSVFVLVGGDNHVSRWPFRHWHRSTGR